VKKLLAFLFISGLVLSGSNCSKTSPTQAAASTNQVRVEIIDSVNWASVLIYANNKQVAGFDTTFNLAVPDSTVGWFPAVDTFLMVPDSSKLTARDVDFTHDTIATANLVWVIHN
jgi:hypothetical protein